GVKRSHVLAELKPSTKTRLDLGLALRDEPFTERLIDTGGRAKKDRITHRVAITRIEDVDDEGKAWLRLAYDLDGGAEKTARGATWCVNSRIRRTRPPPCLPRGTRAPGSPAGART